MNRPYTQLGALILTLSFTVTQGSLAQFTPDDTFLETQVNRALSEGEVEATPKPKKVEFGRYRLYFNILCDELKKDGREPAVYAILHAFSGNDENCVACRPLMRAFSSTCKPRVIPPPRKNDPNPKPTPTSIPKQRDPSAGTIAAASQLFTEMAGDSKSLPETYKAVEKLVYILSMNQEKTKAELEYYNVLCEYIMAPFLNYRRQLDRERSGGNADPVKKGRELNQLFDF